MGSLLLSTWLIFAQTTGTDMPQISVNDPMLAPPVAAPQELGNWQEVLEIVRTRSTDIAFARAGVVRAEAASRVALAALLPQINAQGTATYIPYTSSQSLSGTSFGKVQAQINGSVTFNQSLVNLRSIYALGTAKKEEEVAELTVSDVKRVTTLSVANAMVSVVTAERVADLNRTGLRGALERLDVAQRRRAGGASTGLDVVRAQQDVESARALLVTGDEALRQARETLGLAIGIPGQIGVARTFDPKALEEGTRTMCRSAASIDERSDIMVAKENLVVAGRSLTDAKYQFLPTLNAGSTVSANANDLNFSSASWSISAFLTVPIWDGGARYGALRDAHGQIDQAQSRLDSTKRAAVVQVAQADRGVQVAQDSLAVAQRGRDLAAEVDRLTRRGFAEGSGTSLELVVAAQALRQAEINLALKEFDLLRAKISAALAVANCDF